MAVLESPLALRLVRDLLSRWRSASCSPAAVVGQIPLGLAVCLVGLGLVERDGLLVLGGLGVGALGVTLSLGFI